MVLISEKGYLAWTWDERGQWKSTWVSSWTASLHAQTLRDRSILDQRPVSTRRECEDSRRRVAAILVYSSTLLLIVIHGVSLKSAVELTISLPLG